MNRRRFLKTTALGAALPTFAAPSLPVPTRVIDTHTHFYDVTRPEGTPWPPKGSLLHRRVLPVDWLALAAPLGVKETVVVEASPWVEDNQWILELAAKEKSIVGFVGNLDPNDPQFTSHLKRFAENPIFRGVRWRGDLVKLDASQAKVLAGARLLAARGLTLDLNGPAVTLPQAASLAQQVPALQIVINHLGGSGDPQALAPGWKENIRLVAQQPNVSMKVSALAEQVKGTAGQAPQEVAYYLPILDHLWECFGPERLLFGSNWPVSDRGAPYSGVLKLVKEYFGSKGQDAMERYFWRNSQTTYRWVERV